LGYTKFLKDVLGFFLAFHALLLEIYMPPSHLFSII
jgi:hypothetical protein